MNLIRAFPVFVSNVGLRARANKTKSVSECLIKLVLTCLKEEQKQKLLVTKKLKVFFALRVKAVS